MEIEYRRTWNQSFMLVTGYVEEESYELRMLKHNAVMGLLPVAGCDRKQEKSGFVTILQEKSRWSVILKIMR